MKRFAVPNCRPEEAADPHSPPERDHEILGRSPGRIMSDMVSSTIQLKIHQLGPHLFQRFTWNLPSSLCLCFFFPGCSAMLHVPRSPSLTFELVPTGQPRQENILEIAFPEDEATNCGQLHVSHLEHIFIYKKIKKKQQLFQIPYSVIMWQVVVRKGQQLSMS